MKIRQNRFEEMEWRSRFAHLKKGLFRFRKNKLALMGLFIILSMVFIAVFADYLAPFPDDAEKATHFGQQFQPPSWEHPFGTDEAGRDVLSRTIFGARISLTAALWIQGLIILVGVPLGRLAGYRGGWRNIVIMRSADILLTLPPLALALVAASAFEPSFNVVVMAMVIVWWPWYTRLVQGKVLSIKEEAFVEASRAMGKSSLHIILEDIMPNLLPIITVKATLDMGNVIIYTAALSFLGLGLQPPNAAWGMMIATGRAYLPHYWWLSVFPGIFIFLTVLGFSLLGDGLRDFFDVKLLY